MCLGFFRKLNLFYAGLAVALAVFSLNSLRNMYFFVPVAIVVFVRRYTGTNLVFGKMGFIKYYQLNKARNRLETEIKTLEKDNRTLKTQVTALKQDPFYIEKHAREEYGLARPDEYIFQFKDDGR
ncbi:MAG: Septum formation initiator family protein [Candidatus Giovannonibacteria bacterium GW2011_GWC2_43_8]|nr:MAG: Septum formation initiator family protein [Candidatus Giovannonibacteria bacterium GW2011_GWC2_43_8]